MENLMSHPSYSNNYMYKFSRFTSGSWIYVNWVLCNIDAYNNQMNMII